MRQSGGRRGLADKETRRGRAAVSEKQAAGAAVFASNLGADVSRHGLGYAPAPESREIVSIAPEYGLFVNGEFTPARGGKTFKSVNSATEEL